MKRNLTSLILGAVLALPIASSMPSKAYLEEKTATATAENPKLPIKSEPTFDEFKQALGERYETLNTSEKEKTKRTFQDSKSKYHEIFTKIMPRLYRNTETFYNGLNEESKQDLASMNFKGTPNKSKYLELFPWIKKDFFEKNNHPKNPDKILMYHAICKDVDIIFGGPVLYFPFVDELIQNKLSQLGQRINSFKNSLSYEVCKKTNALKNRLFMEYVGIFDQGRKDIKIYYTDEGIPYTQYTEFVLTSKGLIFPREKFKKRKKKK